MSPSEVRQLLIRRSLSGWDHTRKQRMMLWQMEGREERGEGREKEVRERRQNGERERPQPHQKLTPSTPKHPNSHARPLKAQPNDYKVMPTTQERDTPLKQSLACFLRSAGSKLQPRAKAPQPKNNNEEREGLRKHIHGKKKTAAKNRGQRDRNSQREQTPRSKGERTTELRKRTRRKEGTTPQHRNKYSPLLRGTPS